MILKDHCENIGLDYKEYELTPAEAKAYFSKLSYSPYSGFNMKDHERSST
jgi:hypothetical protein